MDPLTELVRNAIGMGVLMMMDDRERLMAKLRKLDPTETLADALTDDAESFMRTRADLVEAVEAHYES